jgi:hypothetical protein
MHVGIWWRCRRGSEKKAKTSSSHGARRLARRHPYLPPRLQDRDRLLDLHEPGVPLEVTVYPWLTDRVLEEAHEPIRHGLYVQVEVVDGVVGRDVEAHSVEDHGYNVSMLSQYMDTAGWIRDIATFVLREVRSVRRVD